MTLYSLVESPKKRWGQNWIEFGDWFTFSSPTSVTSGQRVRCCRVKEGKTFIQWIPFALLILWKRFLISHAVSYLYILMVIDRKETQKLVLFFHNKNSEKPDNIFLWSHGGLFQWFLFKLAFLSEWLQQINNTPTQEVIEWHYKHFLCSQILFPITIMSKYCDMACHDMWHVHVSSSSTWAEVGRLLSGYGEGGFIWPWKDQFTVTFPEAV